MQFLPRVPTQLVARFSSQFIGRRWLFAFLVVLALPVHGFGSTQVLADDPPGFHGASRPFKFIEPQRPVSFKTILGRDGKPVDMTAYKDKVLLINFWATWCAPCVFEMPTLDRLQGALGGSKFQVLTISVDRRGLEKVVPFWKEKGYRHLPLLLDPKWKTARALGTRGLPTSFLVDHRGNIVGYLEGHADWASDKAKALINYYVKKIKN